MRAGVPWCPPGVELPRGAGAAAREALIVNSPGAADIRCFPRPRFTEESWEQSRTLTGAPGSSPRVPLTEVASCARRR